jgi:hypothetical protein
MFRARRSHLTHQHPDPPTSGIGRSRQKAGKAGSYCGNTGYGLDAAGFVRFCIGAVLRVTVNLRLPVVVRSLTGFGVKGEKIAVLRITPDGLFAYVSRLRLPSQFLFASYP